MGVKAGEDGNGDKNGGLFDCACGSKETSTSATELLIGWGIIGLCWGSGYYLMRKIGRRRKK